MPRIDWSQCILCQKTNQSENLQCPGKSKRTDHGAGYKTLADNLTQFAKVVKLPFDVNLLDDGRGIKATLSNHSACWHKTCRLKYNTSELTRAKKRKQTICDASDCSDEIATKIPRRTGSVADIKSKCFFCEKSSDKD